MKAARIFNLLNGWFYVLYGLFGALQPVKMAELMGWAPDLLGLHQIRAIWMVCFAAGLIIVMTAHKRVDQKPLLLAIIFILLAFATGRLLGLALDGPGPTQTYFELGLEVFLICVGTLIYREANRSNST